MDGKSASLVDVLDELALLPFLGSHRLVVVSDADEFVSAHRAALEKYVEKPHRSGVLVLSVKSWPGNTRLAKMVTQSGLAIDCRSPEPPRLVAWCRQWASERYGKRLSGDAAQLLVELVAGGVGQLDAEIDKLAAYVGDKPEITAAAVDTLVASGRVQVVWNIIDAAAGGDARSALGMLKSLVSSGEQPLLILGAMSAQLRRLARVHRLVATGESPRTALAKAGIQYYADRAQAQLRHLGRDRLGRLYKWLLETDLGIKGESALTPPHLLERLVVRLAARR
jgi:DNA polymerase-3 subunit delta